MHLKNALGLFVSVALLLVARPPTVDGAKILAVYSFPGKSHFMMHKALIGELLRSGHQVTMITAFTLNPEKLGGNYTEILIEPVYDFWHDITGTFATDNLFELTRLDVTDFLKMLEVLGVGTTEHALKQPKVQEIINAKNTKGVYDLLIVEQFYQEAFLPLAQIYDVPVISTSTLGYQNFMSQMFGLITPWSFVPHGFMPFTDQMSFMERVKNSYFSLMEDFNREFIYLPKMDTLVKKYFGHLPMQIPKLSALERNLSLILLNSYIPLTTVRPSTNAMIPVGGMHIYPPKALPSDMQRFLDDAEHGAIYFSLGSNVQSKDMPVEKLNIFLKVFRGMKQRILWKFENESIANLPSNVMVKKWLPQSDILAHPNVKVFITHGGLFGTQEGVHYGVPLLGMPFYCDQHLNMNKAVLGGYAISLHFQSITADILKQALHDLLEQPHYRENMQRISTVFRDRPVSARESAVYWIEYVIRHKGAPHLRSAGLDLPWYQFYLLDVIAAVVAVVLLILFICIAGWRWILKRYSGDDKHQHNKQKKQ